jgi:hypothetical protein
MSKSVQNYKIIFSGFPFETIFLLNKPKSYDFFLNCLKGFLLCFFVTKVIVGSHTKKINCNKIIDHKYMSDVGENASAVLK